MTDITGDVAVDVSLMVKEYMLGHVVDLYPRCGGFCVKILMFLFNPGMVGDDVIMAVQTFFYRRQPRMIRIINIGMTKTALDLLNPAVHRVAEGDRLFRSDPGRRRGIKKIEKSGNRKQNTSGQQNGGDVFSQRSEYLL